MSQKLTDPTAVASTSAVEAAAVHLSLHHSASTLSEAEAAVEPLPPEQRQAMHLELPALDMVGTAGEHHNDPVRSYSGRPTPIAPDILAGA